MPQTDPTDRSSSDVFDFALIAGIGLHLWLQQQTGLPDSVFRGYFPAFLPDWAVIPWSMLCVWFGIRIPELKRVFQCLSGFLLFLASAPLLAILRLPFPFLEDGSSACVCLLLAAGAGMALIAESLGVDWSDPAQSAILRAWMRVPLAGMMAAFGLSLVLDARFGQTPLIAALTGWLFSVSFALTWVWVGRIPPAWAAQNLRCPDLWRRWLGHRSVLGTAAVILVSGSAVALALRYWNVFQISIPDRYSEEFPWAARYSLLLRQGFSLWFPLAVILVLQTLVVLRIHKLAERSAPYSTEQKARSAAD
jgi:hypothetical protein